MLRTSALAALFASSVLALSACGGSDSDSGSSTGSSGGTSSTSTQAASGGGDAQKIAYSSPVAAQPGQQDIAFGFAAAAKTLGWKTSVLDANLSADKQVSDIATMITQKQNGIASWTLDPGAAAGAYGQAKAANIPVIGVNSEGTGIDSTVFWELNTCGADSPIYRTAQYIAKAHPGAKVISIGGPPVPSIQAYVACFKKAAAAAGLKIIASTNNTKDTSAAAQPIAADLITKHPDVQAFWNYNDATALGVSAALVAAGKKIYTGSGDGVVDFGQNGDADAITAVKEGRITGTWDTNSVATGWAIVKDLGNFIGAKKTDSPPKSITVKSDLWTKDNIDKYVAPRDRKYTIDTVPLVGAGS